MSQEMLLNPVAGADINSMPIHKRFMRFSLTGCSSTAVHFCTVLLLVSSLHFFPLAANIVAFLLAFFVSYFGHSRFTFSDFKNSRAKSTLPRFFVIAIFSFALNELFFYYLLHVQHMAYPLALALVLGSVSALTFTLSRVWAFR